MPTSARLQGADCGLWWWAGADWAPTRWAEGIQSRCWAKQLANQTNTQMDSLLTIVTRGFIGIYLEQYCVTLLHHILRICRPTLQSKDSLCGLWIGIFRCEAQDDSEELLPRNQGQINDLQSEGVEREINAAGTYLPHRLCSWQ